MSFLLLVDCLLERSSEALYMFVYLSLCCPRAFPMLENGCNSKMVRKSDISMLNTSQNNKWLAYVVDPPNLSENITKVGSFK